MRNRRGSAVSIICVLLALSGCGVHPDGVRTTIPAAMAGIQSSLAQAGVVSVSHADAWTPQQDARFTRNVQAIQCVQRTPDPVVGTIAGDVTVQLSGTFTQGGQFSVGATPAAPTVAFGGNATRMRGQTLGVSVSYAPLSAMPDIEMGRQMGYETALLGQNDAIRHAESTRLLAGRDALAAKVRGLVTGWRAGACAASAPEAAFVGGRRGG